jgi:hypothetical protein
MSTITFDRRDATLAAKFCAELTRQEVAFEAHCDGEVIRITITGY